MSYPLVTFITATIGRATLQRTAESVLAQTDPNWLWFVEGDGMDPDSIIDSTDKRILAWKQKPFRHESPLRNIGIAQARSDWVAFVDDDDTISPNYVKWLREEAGKNDVVIFRQTFPLQSGEEAIFPQRPEIVWGNVGISYAVRREMARWTPFKESLHEDLLQLVALEAKGAKIHFSPHIAYFARDHRA